MLFGDKSMGKMSRDRMMDSSISKTSLTLARISKTGNTAMTGMHRMSGRMSDASIKVIIRCHHDFILSRGRASVTINLVQIGDDSVHGCILKTGPVGIKLLIRKQISRS